jgi:hypothetical protein
VQCTLPPCVAPRFHVTVRVMAIVVDMRHGSMVTVQPWDRQPKMGGGGDEIRSVFKMRKYIARSVEDGTV